MFPYDNSVVIPPQHENVIIKNSNPVNFYDNNMHGVLLYGINSSGKSSLMKSVGISVILAQAGFFGLDSSIQASH